MHTGNVGRCVTPAAPRDPGRRGQVMVVHLRTPSDQDQSSERFVGPVFLLFVCLFVCFAMFLLLDLFLHMKGTFLRRLVYLEKVKRR